MPKQNISPSTRCFPLKERYEIFDGKIFARKSYRFFFFFVQDFVPIRSALAYDFLSRCKFSSTLAHFFTAVLLGSTRKTLCLKLFMIRAWRSIYLLPGMYNGNVQQNPLCVESCVTKKFSTSLLFSSTIFDPDANSVLLRAHLCPAVDSTMCRKPLVRFFIKMQIQDSY